MPGAVPRSVEAELAFTRPTNVAPDDERPGLWRARTLAPDEQRRPGSFAQHRCRLTDLSVEGAPDPDLARQGFSTADLSGLERLQERLEAVRAAGWVTADDARSIRRELGGARLRLCDGSTLRLLVIASEGFIMRRAGPNGLSVVPAERGEMNDHDAALAVHADQDVQGTPLRQIMRGAAPWIFRHDTPDARNRWSPLWLLNLWIPLDQVTRPLALMDKTSLDRRAHQLRYGLPTDGFLDRDAARRVNDIWTFLHDPEQRWYFTSELDAGRAYVFETLGTPHASFIVPGEPAAETRYRALEEAVKAIDRGDLAALRASARSGIDSPRPDTTTSALGRALDRMEGLLLEAAQQAGALLGSDGGTAWCDRARDAMERVVRKSLEMRVVALRTPPCGRARVAR